MKRFEFIRSIIASFGLLFAPKVEAKKEVRTYEFKNLFTNRVFNNTNLFFLKDSDFKKSLYQDVGHLIKPGGGFYYIGEHDLLLPIKKAYSEDELKEYFILVKHRILKYKSLSQQRKGQPIYFFRDKKAKTLRLELMCDF